MKKDIELKEKALKVIAFLCGEEALSLKFDDKGFVIDHPAQDFIDLIYRTAHAGADTECEHPEWEQELKEMYDKCVKEGLV